MVGIFGVPDDSKRKHKEKIEIIGLLSRIFITLGLIQIVLIAIGLDLPIEAETLYSKFTTKVYFILSSGIVISFIIAFIFLGWLKQLENKPI